MQVNEQVKSVSPSTRRLQYRSVQVGAEIEHQGVSAMMVAGAYKQVELVGISSRSFDRAVDAARLRAEEMWADLRLIRRATEDQPPLPQYVAEVIKLELCSDNGQVSYRATLKVAFVARSTEPPPRKKSGVTRLMERLSLHDLAGKKAAGE